MLEYVEPYRGESTGGGLHVDEDNLAARPEAVVACAPATKHTDDRSDIEKRHCTAQ